MKWMTLLIAIFLEIFGTISLKKSEGFKYLNFGILALIAYASAMFFLSKSLEKFELSTAYTIWSGLGILGAHVAGIYLFKEEFTFIKSFGALLILIGSTLIQMQKI